MKSKSLLAAATLSLGLALTPLFAQAEGFGRSCPFHGGEHMMGFFSGSELSGLERLASERSVTDEQRTKLRAIADKYRPQARAVGDRVRDNRRQLFEQMSSDKPDEAKVMALSESKAKAEGEMIMLRSKIRSEVNGVLTPEQRQRWMEHRHFGGEGRWHGHRTAPDKTENGAGAPKAN